MLGRQGASTRELSARELSARELVLGSQGASVREHVALPRDFSIEDILSREEGIP